MMLNAEYHSERGHGRRSDFTLLTLSFICKLNYHIYIYIHLRYRLIAQWDVKVLSSLANQHLNNHANLWIEPMKGPLKDTLIPQAGMKCI